MFLLVRCGLTENNRVLYIGFLLTAYGVRAAINKISRIDVPITSFTTELPSVLNPPASRRVNPGWSLFGGFYVRMLFFGSENTGETADTAFLQASFLLPCV